MVAFVFFKCFFRSKRYEPSFKWILTIFFCVVSNILVKTSQEMNNSLNSTMFHAGTDDLGYSTTVYFNKTTIEVFLQSGQVSHSYLTKHDLNSGMPSEILLKTSNLIGDVTTEIHSSDTPSDTYSFPSGVTEITSEDSSETTSDASSFPTDVTETTSEESSETTSESSYFPTDVTETTSEESSETTSESSSFPNDVTETTSEESTETTSDASSLPTDVTETTSEESSETTSNASSLPTNVTETTSEESSETTSETSYFPTNVTETTSEESSETTSESSSFPTDVTETTSEESSETTSEASSLTTDVITETTSEISYSPTNDITDSNSTDSDITTIYTPTDVPPSNFFNVTDAETGVACILAELSVALNVSYDTSSGESSVVSIFIPATARSGGNCSGDRPYLSVLWEPSTSGGRILRDLDSNQLNLYMAQGTSTYFVDAIDLYLMMDAFPDAVEPVLSTNATNLRLFETSKQRSFTCSREEVVPMGRVELVVVNVRLQAFNNDSTVTDFHQAEDCDNSSGLISPRSAGLGVGAIVGISLAVATLLFLVSTTYFLRRRRSTGSFSPIMSDV